MAIPTQPNVTQELNQATTEVKTWSQKHERLIIVFLVLTFATFLAQKYFDLSAKIADAKNNVAQTVLQAQAQKDEADLAQAKQLLITYEQSLQQSQEQNAQLVAKIAANNVQLAKQQATDAKLTPSQLSIRWQGLVNNTGIETAANGYAVTDDAAIDTVQQLEQVPVLTQNLKDETVKEANLQTNIDDANKLIDKGKITVDGLQLQIQDQQKACTTQVAAVTANATKSKLKWFGAGFIIGFVTGHIW